MKVDRSVPVNERIEQAFRTASETTGTSFQYLANTAYRESSFQPDLKAKTSSATGLFQFIEQTWLGMVKEEGASVGMSRYAAAITKSSSGRYDVADPAMRKEILGLRNDPLVSSVMAGKFAARNATALEHATGRKPTQQDLYVAHVLGAAGGAKLIRMKDETPGAAAAGSFSRAAEANPSIFYAKDGRARSASEVYALLAKNHSDIPLTTDTSGSRIASAHMMFSGKPAAVVTSPAAVADMLRAQAAARVSSESVVSDPQKGGAADPKATRRILSETSIPGQAAGTEPPKSPQIQGWRAKLPSDAFSGLIRSDDASANAPHIKAPGILGYSGDAAPASSGTASLSIPGGQAQPVARPSRYAAAARYGAPESPLPMVTSSLGVARPGRFSMASLYSDRVAAPEPVAASSTASSAGGLSPARALVILPPSPTGAAAGSGTAAQEPMDLTRFMRAQR